MIPGWKGRDEALAVFAEHGDPVDAKTTLEALLRSRGFRIVPGLADFTGDRLPAGVLEEFVAKLAEIVP